MHRYLVKDKYNMSYVLISANNIKEAEELLYNYKRKTMDNIDGITVKLYKADKELHKKIYVFISKKWIKFRNE